MRRFLLSVLLVLQFLTIGMVAAPATVSAAEDAFCAGELGPNIFFNFPTWYKYLDYDFVGNACEIEFEVRNPRDYVAVAMALFEVMLRIAGMAALAFVMYGAFQLLTSQGEPERYAAARTTLSNALIGLAIAISAVAIVNLIGGNIV